MSQVQVFPCPNCKEFIAGDAGRCRFCQTPVDPQVARQAASAQSQENQQFRRGHYRKHLTTGGLLFALGAAITVGSYLFAASRPEGGGYVMTWGLIAVGGFQLLYGAYGLVGERFSK